jgi:hypothetical protein
VVKVNRQREPGEPEREASETLGWAEMQRGSEPAGAEEEIQKVDRWR